MAKGVIHLFEVVNVDHQKSKLLLLAFSALEFQIKLLFKIAASTQSGQVIGKRETQQAFIGVFAREQIFRHQGKDPKKLSVFLAKAIHSRAEQLQRTHDPIADEQRHGKRGRCFHHLQQCICLGVGSARD
jgi:hypothetical protein